MSGVYNPILVFDAIQILEVRSGKSQKGTEWTRVQFLDLHGLQVYEVMQFGEDSADLIGFQRGLKYKTDWQVSPDRSSGIRLNLISAQPLE